MNMSFVGCFESVLFAYQFRSAMIFPEHSRPNIGNLKLKGPKIQIKYGLLY